MPKKKPLKGKPTVNKELQGFEIEINELGEIKSNFSVDRINRFLDKEVEDKKLTDHPDHIQGEGRSETPKGSNKEADSDDASPES